MNKETLDVVEVIVNIMDVADMVINANKKMDKFLKGVTVIKLK